MTEKKTANGNGLESIAGIKRVERPEPIVTADALAYVVFERRDVAEMSRFLRDFGLVFVEAASDGTYYFRGYGTAPYLVVIEASGRDRFKGIGIQARTAQDFERFAAAVGVGAVAGPGPGGGKRVRLVDPDGLQVDLVYGATPAPPLSHETLPPVNVPSRHVRVNTSVWPAVETSLIVRLGHVVLERLDFMETAQWYMRHFGFIASDAQVFQNGEQGLGFFRLDRGAGPTGHHSLAILGGVKTGVFHVSFETFNREALGSQLFDCWKDPVGDEWEHYADGDVLNATQPAGYHWLMRGGPSAWGDNLPDSLRPDISVDKLEELHAAGAFGDLPLEKVWDLFTALQAHRQSRMH